MPKVRLNDDGWLALPAAARRALGVDTGDQLKVEVVDGRIVLRPLKPSAADEQLPAVAPEPVPTVAASPSEKRRPGRPRKTTAAPSAASTVLLPRLKARGAQRKVATVGETPS
jgi:AbrB family looped-hinge helix DNA binding protein